LFVEIIFNNILCKVFNKQRDQTKINNVRFMNINRQNVLRIFIFLYLILVGIDANAQNKSDSSNQNKSWTIDECVNEFNLKDTIGTNIGYQYWFFDKNFIDGRTLKISVVAPHSATHAPHKHPEDEFFFVLEGTAEFYLNGKTAVGKQYSAFYCPRNIEHGIINIGDTKLKYLVIKKYEQTN
jgi:mannose-6-phosphate isomerase-like protein (cupin superfamily)